MAYDRQKVIDIALGEVGYREKATNSQLDDKTANSGSGNWTKYARDLDAIPGFYNGPKNGYAYCDMTVDWCFVQAYGVEAAKKLLCQPDYSAGAGCTYSLEYFRKAGRIDHNAEAGAQVFFGAIGDSYHTGLVTRVVGRSVHTVEGNSSDAVRECVYDIDDSCIACYGHPAYDDDYIVTGIPATADHSGEAADMVLDCTTKHPTLRRGSNNGYVITAQIMLVGRGYWLGTDGVRGNGTDGDFGELTERALKTFQDDEGLTKDGVCGQKTWEALLKC